MAPDSAPPEAPAEPTDAAEKKALKDDGLDTVPAAERAMISDREYTRGGFMDQLSTRNDNDAFEGHFVTIDLSNKDVQKAYKDTQGLADHTGNYGVFIQPVEVDPDTGIPVLVTVRLRDETNALVSVPYEALTPADTRGR